MPRVFVAIFVLACVMVNTHAQCQLGVPGCVVFPSVPCAGNGHNDVPGCDECVLQGPPNTCTDQGCPTFVGCRKCSAGYVFGPGYMFGCKNILGQGCGLQVLGQRGEGVQITRSLVNLGYPPSCIPGSCNVPNCETCARCRDAMSGDGNMLRVVLSLSLQFSSSSPTLPLFSVY
jgi:hypothetical protein